MYGDKHMKLFETRILISDVGKFRSYRLLRCPNSGSGSSHTEIKESFEESRIFVKMNRLSDEIYDSVKSFKYSTLSHICPVHSPFFRHLYMDFSWSPNAFTYTSGLPGPTTGEKAKDRYHDVEVK
jgi:hypothetical protein